MTPVYFILLLCSLASAEYTNDAGNIANVRQVPADGLHHGLLSATADYAGGRSDLSGLNYVPGSGAYHGSGYQDTYRHDLASNLYGSTGSNPNGLLGSAGGDVNGLYDQGLSYYRSAGDSEAISHLGGASALGDLNDRSDHQSAGDANEASSRSYYPYSMKRYRPFGYGSRPRLPNMLPARRPTYPTWYRSDSSLVNELGDSVSHHVSEHASYRGVDSSSELAGAAAGAGSGMANRADSGLDGLYGGYNYENLRSGHEGSAYTLGVNSAVGSHAMRY